MIIDQSGKPLITKKAANLLRLAKEEARSFENKLFGDMYVHAIEQKLFHGNHTFLKFLSLLERPPVSIEEFLDNKEFLGATDMKLWPEVRKAIIEINRDWWKGLAGGAVFEALLKGATSVGKSSISIVTTLYHLHILSCMRVPQEFYGLPSATSIVFIIQAAKPHVTKKVIYTPLRKNVEEIPYFQKHFVPNKMIESELYFDKKNIRVVPGGADSDSILGEAIIGACFPADQQFLLSDGTLGTMRMDTPLSVKTRDNSGAIIDSPLTRVVYTGRKPFIKLSFSNGTSIVCTPGQKFKGLNNEWIEAKNAAGRYFRFNSPRNMRSGESHDNNTQCIYIEYPFPKLKDCYDIENSGETHIFFAKAGYGFLEAKNCLDELNFMQIVQKSKRADVSSGRSGTYDQAENVHSAVTRRKKSRFISQGPAVGVICSSSSTRYKGDFTDRRERQVIQHNERGVYVYDKKQYEVWPKERYCGQTFRLLVGNEVFSDTRILGDNESVHEGCLVLDIPIEYREDFQQKPYDALRDIVGMSTSSISPFFRMRHRITEAVMLGQEAGLESFLVKDNVVLGVDGMPMIKRGHFCRNPSRPRYVHIDLSLTGDRTGIGMVRFDGMMEITRSTGVVEYLPKVSVELACSIAPDGTNEINIAEIRTWVKQLKDIYGYPIKAVTYDGFMGIESMQAWKKQGMKTGHVSVDRTSVPYKQFRDALYDGRVHLYQQDVLIQELFDLDYDEVKDKVDHSANGCNSKDCADGVVGAYTTLLSRSASWQSVLESDNEISTLREDRRFEERERFDEERY